MDLNETPRMIVDNAIKKFHSSKNPDDRLRSLWKISQLVEDTTDEELYDLAQAIVLEDDARLRGEICYTISRSGRPKLIQFVTKMLQDKNQYVRQQAMNAINKMDNVKNTGVIDVESLLNIINDLKTTITNLEKELDRIKNSETSANSDSIVMDDRMKSWETYLRNEKELLRDHRGKYVAIYKGDIIAIDESDERLAKMIKDRYGEVEVLICKIEEEEEPIQIPYDRNIVEV